MLEIKMGKHLEFDYTNWKGVLGHRKIEVLRIYFGSTEFHPEAQWLLEALDLDKKEYRIFAMKDIFNVIEMV